LQKKQDVSVLQTNGSGVLSFATGGGKVLQVVSTTKTDTFSVSSTSFTTITGLTATITPSSASNKILIIASITGTQDVGVNDVFFGLFRDSTQIGLGDASSTRTRATFQISSSQGSWGVTGGANHLDSPSSTSAITYSIKCRQGVSGNVYVNRTSSDADSVSTARTVSTITVMEIAP
jgi:hypothetical protein